MGKYQKLENKTLFYYYYLEMCKFGIKIHTSPCKTKQKPKKQKQTPNVASRPQRPQGFLGTGEAKDAHLDFHTPPEKHTQLTKW